jgi:DNA repair protein RecO (recombination protein O)
MTETTTGLILRLRLLTESSLIVHWLTPDVGRLATVAKGARRPKSPFRGKLDLFYLADFSFSRSRRSELHTLSEVRLRETHSALRQELGHLRQASYCAELVELSTETEAPLGTVFDLMLGFLAHLLKRPPQPGTIFAFELKLLKELGLDPLQAETGLTSGARQLVTGLAQGDWELVQRLRPSSTQADEIQRFLGRFLAFHLGRVPKGRAAALETGGTPGAGIV